MPFLYTLSINSDGQNNPLQNSWNLVHKFNFLALFAAIICKV